MSEARFLTLLEDSSQNDVQGGTFHPSTPSQHVNALAVVCSGLFIYLLVPKRLKRKFCNSYPRRFAISGSKRLAATKEEATRIRKILPFAKNALKDTRLAWEGDKKFMENCSPSEANSNVTLDYTYGQQVCVASQFLYKANAFHTKENTNSWRSPDTCSSMHSSPARLFTNDTLKRSYGSINQRDVNLMTGPYPVQPSKEYTQLHENCYQVDESKRLVVLISKGNLDNTKGCQQMEALALLRKRGVPFDVIDGQDPKQKSRQHDLCRISGVHSNYPQFFFLYNDGSISFLGDNRILLKAHDIESLPNFCRNNTHRDVLNWDSVFVDTSQMFGI